MRGLPTSRACHPQAYTRGLHGPDNRRAAESAAGAFLILSLLLRREQKEKEATASKGRESKTGRRDGENGTWEGEAGAKQPPKLTDGPGSGVAGSEPSPR